MSQIRFGTDGWRAIIAREFTVENVARVAEASARWMKQQSENPSLMLGHDCRFGGELFAETVAKVMGLHNIRVFMGSTFVTAPMISMGTKQYNCTLGVFITASHNPPLYNGYKLKGPYGGPLLEDQVREVERLIPDSFGGDLDAPGLDDLQKSGLLEYVDLETYYCEYLENKFDLDSMRNAGVGFAFDAMYGSGQNVMKRLFPGIMLLHCERQPLFGGIPPEPLAKNLRSFSEAIRGDGNIDCGLAVDGDADRTALMNGRGEYIDSHHVILLLIYYLHKVKGMKGKVATGFSSTVKIDVLCKAFGIPLDIVKIGFKHICGIMLEEEVLVGGEESGGIAVAGHIPERDGIYNGLTIWEAMVKTGKSLDDLVGDVYAITGPFAFERADLTMGAGDKERIVQQCRDNAYARFGPYQVTRTENLDGFKFYFSDSQWLMIRPSGTEPVLRTYAEGATRDEALDILEAGYRTIMEK